MPQKTYKCGVAGIVTLMLLAPSCAASGLVRSANETLEEQGLSVLVHQNKFHPIFFDEKNAAIQIVLHDERIATDGEVRLNPTPEQWDPIPIFVSRKAGKAPNTVVVRSGYADKGLTYTTEVVPEEGGFKITVNLDKPLPKDLAGKAGFNLDFVPTSYFGKTYLMGSAPGLFPRTPLGPMQKNGSGDPEPLAQGAKTVTLSPEDPLTRVTITSDAAPLALFDARNRAQNGWFVVRALIPAGVTKNAVVWHVKPNVVEGWTRKPVISFNQAGYTPNREKVAILELDPLFKAPENATLLRIEADGTKKPVLTGKIAHWGKWTRYVYAKFDFSAVKEPGLYTISYAGETTNPFRIAPDAYEHIWQPTLDTYIAEQMDHMAIREQYRVWSGLSHMDDARQASPNVVHFDGYKMGPNLDSPFKPGEHIPGLNIGGWQDAGDYDIQTPENAMVVRQLVQAREVFGLAWDETTINEKTREVEIRKPDGVDDGLQQIRHGVFQLLAQYKTFGHAIVGIIDPTLKQYTHLGDAGSQSDRLIYDPSLAPGEMKDGRSGNPDDRLAFTTDVPANDYQVAAGLAAASRALKDTDPKLAAEALEAAKTLWKNQENLGDRADRPGRDDAPRMLQGAATVATVELILATKGDALYTNKLKSLMPTVREFFPFFGGEATLALPYMDAGYRAELETLTKEAKVKADAEIAKTPFGVPVSLGTWAGSGQVAMFGTNMYLLHKAFPNIVGKEYSLAAIDYLLGRHPVHNLSLVTGVGASSKMIMYGHNRADYSYVPGALTPGVIVLQPDYPEQKIEWPFLWFENEATVAGGAGYILSAKAAIEAAKE